ncbi:MAG: amino acid ABC transporter substrate-binding protein [Lachnospiraceae bacterium]|nr:amino acid ABC transporter substrate-binding protein [Lachnospiraceae bacterium]
MKNKFFTLIIAALMLVSLAGCTSKKPAEQTSPEKTEESTKTGDNESDGEKELSYDKIIIGLDDTFAPMGFRDEKGGLVGFDIDLANATSEILGIPFEFQPIDWSMKETELNNKNIDLIWNAYTITPEREEKVLFTEPYLENRQVVVVLADSPINTLADLSGKTVAAQAESSAIDAIDSKPEVKDTFKELVTFDTNNECLLDLEAKRTDAVVGDEVLLAYYISQKGSEKYKVLEENFGDELYGIGGRKEDTELIAAIDKALDTLAENGKGEEISIKWFGENKLK